MPREPRERRTDTDDGPSSETDRPAVSHRLDRLRREDLVVVAPGVDLTPPRRPQLSDEAIRALIDRRPTLRRRASRDHDGRDVPVVLVAARRPDGSPAAGVPVRLRLGGRLVDRTRTDGSGVAVLLGEHGPVPAPSTDGSDQPHDAASLPAQLEVEGLDGPVDVHLGAPQGTITDVEVPLAGDAPDEAAPTDGTDQLDRLPAVFSPALCESLNRLSPATADPIFANVAGVGDGDFRTKRQPLIKRFSAVRVAVPPMPPHAATHVGAHLDVPEGNLPSMKARPRRYLVQFRQEWRFVTYTLGELARVENLDPGRILRTVTSTVSRTVTESREQLDQVLDIVRATLERNLEEVRSLDQVVDRAVTDTQQTVQPIASTVTTTVGNVADAATDDGWSWLGAAVGAVAGFVVGGPVGAVAGGIAGGVLHDDGPDVGGATQTVANSAGDLTRTLHSTLELTDSLDSTVNVTELVKRETERTSQTVSTLTSIIRQLERMTSESAEQVSPILARVANLVRWRMYENYLVCTHVEDVHEIVPLDLSAFTGLPEGDLFLESDVVEYRWIFERALLRPELRGRFEHLARRLDGAPARQGHATIELEVDLPAVSTGMPGMRATIHDYGVVRVSIGGRSATARLTGDRRLRLDLATGHSEPGTEFDVLLELDISSLKHQVAALPSLFGDPQVHGPVRVTRARAWFGTTLGAEPDVDVDLGSQLQARVEAPVDTAELRWAVPTPDRTSTDPLVRHINRNRAYYFELLLRAALARPHLREDAPQLAAFGSQHWIWRLPVYAVEGDTLYLLRDVLDDDAAAAAILADPGAATIVQLAAPGTYAEALEGVLELTDVKGLVHPAVLPVPAPNIGEVSLLDIDGLTGGRTNDLIEIPEDVNT